ncbi:beta-sandwich domain-containing protein [Bdellovibrio bacteriovorus]|uniref:beta-sandwich domain-containing protein n=1 Tax=Bdellovibrio bacteriovorus TaxID=959 RepID=UPI0035A5777E
MKKKLIVGMLAAAAVMQATSPAMAEYSERRPAPYPEAPPMPPPPPGQYLQEGSLEIQGVTRRTGGEWYRISLRRAVSLERIEVAALAMRLKIHDASVITEDGRRVSIREFRNTAVFGVGSRAVSENLNLRSRIVAIDILAESYGGYADVRVTALSTDSRPQLVLGNLPQQPGGNGNGGHNGGHNGGGNNGGHGGGNYACARRADVTRSLEQQDVEMDAWSRRKNAASYNSVEYNMADRELKATAARMVQIAKSNEAKETKMEKLEVLGALYFQKMNQQSYNSTQYNAYSEVGRAIFSAMENGLKLALDCDIRTTVQLLARGDEYVGKMNTYSYNSVPYNAYSRMAQQVYAAAPNFYEQEVRRLDKTFMKIDEELDENHRKMNSYSYNSVGYNSYAAIIRKGVELSQGSLRRLVPHMGSLQRFDLVKHFDGRKNAYSYNSLLYNHFAAMKEIAAR